MCSRCMKDNPQLREDMKNGFLDIVKGKDLTFACIEAAKASRMNAAKKLGVLMEFMLGMDHAHRRVHDWSDGYMNALCSDDFNTAWSTIQDLVPEAASFPNVGSEGVSKRARGMMGIYQAFRVLSFEHEDVLDILVHLNDLPDGDLECVADNKTMKEEEEKLAGADPKGFSGKKEEIMEALMGALGGHKVEVHTLSDLLGGDLVERLKNLKTKLEAKGDKTDLSQLIGRAMAAKLNRQAKPSCGGGEDPNDLRDMFSRDRPPPSKE